MYRFNDERVITVRRLPPHPSRVQLRDEWRRIDTGKSLYYTWTGTTTFTIEGEHDSDPDEVIQEILQEPEPPDPEDPGEEQKNVPPEASIEGGPTTSPAPTTGMTERAVERPTTQEGSKPEPKQEEIPPPGEVSEVLAHQKRLYEGPHEPEDFKTQRTRVDKQKTLSFLQKPWTYGPIRSKSSRASPYEPLPEEIEMQIEIDLQQATDLPPGWHVEDGWLFLDVGYSLMLAIP